MHVIPYSDIAIQGRHCPAGVSVEIPDREGLSLLAQRLVRRGPPPSAAQSAPAPAAEAAAAHERALAEAGPETAAVAPAAEQAVARPTFKPRRRQP